MSAPDAVDAFAGPGGWDVAADELGISTLGIEWDDAACATRRIVGHATLQADVAALDPLKFVSEGQIASPPCPSFSSGGKRVGGRDMQHIIECAHELAAGTDRRAAHRDACEDKRSILVVEPLRFVLAVAPRWVAWEQVPPVLPFWELCGEILRARGYHVWTGLLHAEQFGVPQTRKRAILMANRERAVAPPEPTHRKYVPPRYRKAELTLEEQVLEPWISMADALGWGMTERPYLTIASSRTTGGPDKEKVGSSAARAALYGERDRGAWVSYNSRDQRDGRTGKRNRMRSEVEPAPTISGESRNDSWVVADTGNTRGGSREEGRLRTSDEPAVCITSRADQLERRPRESAPRDVDWPTKRPATTLSGDPRIAQPGHKNEEASPDSPGRMEGSIRVSLEEAAVLQGFRRDYPFQGTKSKQFQQVGNAIPPPLARAILEAVR